MPGWEEWDRLLGGGSEQTISVGLTGKDSAGRESSLIVRRRDKKGGHAIFELFINPQSTFGNPAGPPTEARIVSLEVEGFVETTCTGKKTCAQFKWTPADMKLLKPSAGSKFSFEPAGSDDGLLSELLEKCSCGQDEASYATYITVEIQPAPATTMRFSCCDSCACDPDEADA
jgi:hypothetical protein